MSREYLATILRTPDDKKPSRSQTSEQKALKYISEITACLSESQYPEFEEGIKKLMQLTQENDEPMPCMPVGSHESILKELIKIVETYKSKFRSNKNSALAIARALHLYSDLLVIDFYNNRIPLDAKDKKNYFELLDEFRKLFRYSKQDYVEINYELDCCCENIRVHNDTESLWDDLKLIFQATLKALSPKQDFSSLLELIVKFSNRLGKFWQVDILLLRCLTPLAQKSIKVLELLQKNMGKLRKNNNFQVIYAIQESLYQVIQYAQGPDRVEIQRQAFGMNHPWNHKLYPTMRYFSGIEITGDRSEVFYHQLGNIKIRGIEHRYRFVQALKKFSQLPINDKPENRQVLAWSIQLLTYLSCREPTEPTLIGSKLRADITSIWLDLVLSLGVNFLSPTLQYTQYKLNSMRSLMLQSGCETAYTDETIAQVSTQGGSASSASTLSCPSISKDIVSITETSRIQSTSVSSKSPYSFRDSVFFEEPDFDDSKPVLSSNPFVQDDITTSATFQIPSKSEVSPLRKSKSTENTLFKDAEKLTASGNERQKQEVSSNNLGSTR